MFRVGGRLGYTEAMSETAAQTELFLKTLQVGPLQCNCTIIGNKASGEAIVVDPGGDADRILAILAGQGLNATRILHTHAHFDHFLAAGELHEQTGAPLCLHKEDMFLWEHLDMQCQMFGVPCKPVPAPSHFLEHEEELPLCGCGGKALFTPGHTPGSMSFLFENANLLIAGDTLFRNGVGRTDLWGGDSATIERSIKTQLYTLNEDLRVVTGHGISTTIGHEMRNNPFIRA
jgi:hydroxyacylglutathione hydrolase